MSQVPEHTLEHLDQPGVLCLIAHRDAEKLGQIIASAVLHYDTLFQ